MSINNERWDPLFSARAEYVDEVKLCPSTYSAIAEKKGPHYPLLIVFFQCLRSNVLHIHEGLRNLNIQNTTATICIVVRLKPQPQWMPAMFSHQNRNTPSRLFGFFGKHAYIHVFSTITGFLYGVVYAYTNIYLKTTCKHFLVPCH